jgi:DNA repair exonuclease SbcCD ATPase subunit
MLASPRPLAPAFSRARTLARASALACVAAVLGGCATERETTLSRSARQRELAEQRAERERLARERVVLDRTVGEAQAAADAARQRSILADAEQRTALVALRHDLEQLQRAEQDLAAAKARAAAIEQELAPLRALEATLRDRERLHAETTARLAALQAQVQAGTEQAAKLEAELQPRLVALQAKLATLQQLGATLTTAEAAIATALATLQPPPAPAAATPAAPGSPAPATPAKK